LIGRQNGLLASVSAGKIILTFIGTPPARLFELTDALDALC
jgi:hypothetical protein